MLTREALIKAHTKEVTLEGGSVIIRALTAAEAFELRGKDLQSAEIFAFNALGAKAVEDATAELKKTDGLTSN